MFIKQLLPKSKVIKRPVLVKNAESAKWGQDLKWGKRGRLICQLGEDANRRGLKGEHLAQQRESGTLRGARGRWAR